MDKLHRGQVLARRLCVLAMLIAGLIASLVLEGSQSASAASSAPAITQVAKVPNSTGEDCVNNLSWDPPEVCIQIHGTGTYVDWMQAWVGSGYAVGRFHITGPGYSFYSSVYNVEGGFSIRFSFNRYVTAGKWCMTFQNKNSSGAFANKGTACDSVS
jgi:hypothetical protein